MSTGISKEEYSKWLANSTTTAVLDFLRRRKSGVVDRAIYNSDKDVIVRLMAQARALNDAITDIELGTILNDV